MLRIFPAVAALALALALAPTLPGRARAAGVTHLRYALYVHGFHVLQVNATLQFEGAHYTVELEDHTVGLLGALTDTRAHSRAEGTLDGTGAHPVRYQSAGHSRGTDRQTLIETANNQPVVRVLSPVETRRDKIPPAAVTGAIDPLSAFAALVARTAATGRCDAAFTVFDGARLTDFAVRSAGTATLPDSDRSRYAGTALRCDFQTREVAGFLHDDHYAHARDPQGGTAWVGRIAPDAPPVPIRAEFSTLDHGPVAGYLVEEGSGS